MTLDELRKEATAQGYTLKKWCTDPAKYDNRPKSKLVALMLTSSGKKLTKELADILGLKSVQTLRNKLSRDIFTFDELVGIAGYCGFSFSLTNGHGETVLIFPETILEKGESGK